MKGLPSLIEDTISAALVAEDETSLESIMDSAKLIEPSPVQFSFNTPGWYFTGILLIIVIIVLSIRWLIAYRKNAYRREAIVILETYDNKPEELAQILTTLKIVAIATFGREKVASLSGADWFKFLNSSSKKASFTEVEKQVLHANYNDEVIDGDIFQKLLSISKKWILTHA